MSSLVEYYKRHAKPYFSDNSWLLEIQNKALKDLDALHFPTRHDEDWKYSPLDSFLQHEFSINKSDSSATKHDLIMAQNLQFEAKFGIKISIVDGNAIRLEEVIDKLPPGVIIEPISSALNKYPDLVTKHLNQILTINHGMHALNSAMLRQGLFIYVPKKVKLLEPIFLTHVNTEANSAIFLRHLIVAEQDSLLNVIEDYQGEQNNKYLTNVITEIFVGEQAQIQHFKMQREGFKALHFGHIFVKQLKSSQFKSHLLNIGGHWSRADISVDLIGCNAKSILNGVYMPVNEQFIENKTFVNHAVANCYSDQDYRGMASDKAQAVFNGKIYVAKDAVHTEARQQNKNLLLSNFAKIFTKPQLEIFADDVACTHGATIGQLDEDSLFYFATRGINEFEARRYLLHAFIDENITKVEDKDLSVWMSSLLEQQMR